jgi:p-aminobenzoyl-glutamate transporter AbgT
MMFKAAYKIIGFTGALACSIMMAISLWFIASYPQHEVLLYENSPLIYSGELLMIIFFAIPSVVWNLIKINGEN